MSIAARMTDCPIPYDRDRAADALALLPGLMGPLADLIGGTAGCSPYLSGLIAREGDWLPAALDDPESALAETLAAITALPPDQLAPGLRLAKRRTALLVALADLAGVWPLEQVTGALTRLSDAALTAGLIHLTASEIARGGLPGQTATDAATGAGMVIMAMGKTGAGELNYSSDIDLICLFDETRFDRADYPVARATFVKITRRLMALIGDQTADGYVFRTDLRLRPDAAVTPVCMAMAGAEAYYEAEGRTWERAAWIKARPCAGDIAAGRAFQKTLTPFVWRKHLDYAAIQDAHDMRLRIRDHRGLHGPLTLPGHDLKLGQGGIREIEFFTQTRQLIAGGRDASLRDRTTVGGLAALAAAGWVPPDTARALTDHYRAHRTVEHRLQMLNDAQTHALPANDDGFARLAAFMATDPATLRRTLTDRLTAVADLTEGFFTPSARYQPTDDWGAATTAHWPRYPALKSPRALDLFQRLRPAILSRLRQSADPDGALAAFDTFLSGLPAGVQLFALFDANPDLTRLVIDICATSPALARYLSRNARVFDAVIGGQFFAPLPDAATLRADLARILTTADRYEAALDAARVWMKEAHFRIGVHQLQGLTDPDGAAAAYAALAEATVAALWPRVQAEFAAKHGDPPGQGAVVLGMGSLGAGRLNAGSDLDLILIYDPAGAEASTGARPLATRPYYARLTQALVTALSAPTAEGRLYEVDMRLRPSGRQGPVATSLDAFQSYQKDQAWTWEHLALTRARVIAGPPALTTAVEAFRRDLLAAKAEGPSIRADVADMRARIVAARGQDGPLDAKSGPGRLMEVDLAAQTCALLTGNPVRATGDQIGAGVADGLLTVADGAALMAAQRLFWTMQAAGRLLIGGTMTMDNLAAGARAMLLRDTGATDLAALAALADWTAAEAAAAFDRLLAQP